ncbi:MAG TPA: hypothetical protein VGL94_18095 [Ktedonobacteraceae bacterium]|jgi:hypothetical protein
MMPLNFKLRREIFERNTVDFADLADVTFREVYDFEESGIATEKVIRKCFAAIEQLQRRALTESEKEHLLDEPFDPRAALETQKRFEQNRPAREARKDLAREQALTAQRLREL